MPFMNIELQINTDEQIKAVLTALAGCSSVPHPDNCGPPAGVTCGPAELPPEDGELDEEPVKPKRTRRTKAQIAADNAAKEAAKAERAEPVVHEAVTTADVKVEKPAITVASESTVETAVVRQAVIDAIARIGEAGRGKTATKEVVAVLKTLTGKGKIAEIDAKDYQRVIDHLVTLAV